MSTPTRFRLDNVRVDWPNLFRGEQFQGTGAFRCGAALIVPTDHPQLPVINAAIDEAAKAKLKDGGKAALFLKSARAKGKVCLSDGDLKAAKNPHYEGTWVLSANCKGGDTEAECEKPTVYDQFRNQVTDPQKNPIYRGCYVNALVEIYADNRYGEQVNCKLVGIQFRKDGDAFGSAPARADDFDDVTEGATAEDFV
jgi:hypothetical protein